MTYFFQKSVSAVPTEPTVDVDRASLVPLKPSRAFAGQVAPTSSIPRMETLIHLELEPGLEVHEVDQTIPGDLYDELFKRDSAQA